jgi:hypothetical protein
MLLMAKAVNQPKLITYHTERLAMWRNVHAMRRQWNTARLKRDLKKSIEQIDAEMREVCL